MSSVTKIRACYQSIFIESKRKICRWILIMPFLKSTQKLSQYQQIFPHAIFSQLIHHAHTHCYLSISFFRTRYLKLVPMVEKTKWRLLHVKAGMNPGFWWILDGLYLKKYQSNIKV